MRRLFNENLSDQLYNIKTDLESIISSMNDFHPTDCENKTAADRIKDTLLDMKKEVNVRLIQALKSEN